MSNSSQSATYRHEGVASLVSRRRSTRDNWQLTQLVLDRARGLIREDATGRLMRSHFTTIEPVFSFFEAARGCLEWYCEPGAFYSDRADVFRRTAAHKEAQHDDFGRALYELNIDTWCANRSAVNGSVDPAPNAGEPAGEETAAARQTWPDATPARLGRQRSSVRYHEARQRYLRMLLSRRKIAYPTRHEAFGPALRQRFEVQARGGTNIDVVEPQIEARSVSTGPPGPLFYFRKCNSKSADIKVPTLKSSVLRRPAFHPSSVSSSTRRVPSPGSRRVPGTSCTDACRCHAPSRIRPALLRPLP